MKKNIEKFRWGYFYAVFCALLVAINGQYSRHTNNPLEGFGNYLKRGMFTFFVASILGIILAWLYYKLKAKYPTNEG